MPSIARRTSRLGGTVARAHDAARVAALVVELPDGAERALKPERRANGATISCSDAVTR